MKDYEDMEIEIPNSEDVKDVILFDELSPAKGDVITTNEDDTEQMVDTVLESIFRVKTKRGFINYSDIETINGSIVIDI